ncbi:MAG: MlrC C-terminal domain-containing protein, partial [Symbiobacteriaceae bacterium]|nr:MlrC C-terminal domain-containing protein [Symbiobacteriaceae bacterium]
AVWLGMHGGMVAQGVDDPELDIVTSVRQLVGDIPIIVTLDLHSNLQQEMVEACQGIFGFDTNPHIDSYERAKEAAEHLARIFNEGIKPVCAFKHPPMVPPTINLRTEEGPMVPLFAKAREHEANPDVYNVYVFGGFPFADVPYAGLNVVTTAASQELAQSICDEIAAMAWETRAEFLKYLPDCRDALDLVEKLWDDNDKRPIIVADVADNPGGGGTGDTPELLRELIKRNLPRTAAAIIWDPQVVEQAIQLGVGKTAKFSIGGKASTAYGAPIEVEAYVAAICDGRYEATGPMGRGSMSNLGKAVRLVVGNVQILVNSVRQACNDADIFRHLGVEPTRQRLLLVKSRGHFRASFQPLAKEIIEVDAPGAANPNLKRYPYKNINYWPLNSEWPTE